MNTACMGAHNVKPQEKYARVEREAVEFEEIHTEDAKVILAAFGICSRICLSTVERLRADGIKAGLFRPKTLFPFPKQQLARLAEECGQLIVVELANGQMTPTTILKQKTATTPQGRSLCNEGVPIVKALYVPAADMAKELGFTGAANMVVLAAMARPKPVPPLERLVA
jgi:pyruvate/2-oxoacid:ferredoxin oxidoreductase alpha subunit